MKKPHMKLTVFMIPKPIGAKNILPFILAFDAIGLIFQFLPFDHAGHLGGTLFGM